MLTIQDLCVTIEQKTIIPSLSLEINSGEMVALMGPNGSGKSTLANVLAGHPSYAVESGGIVFFEDSLLELAPEERAAAGLLLAFQYPPALPGVSVARFLHLALTAQEKAQKKPLTTFAPFIKLLREALKQQELPYAFAERSVNEGFSGGEKKRLEMVQLLILKPRLVILDEIDSGLDIDAIRMVASAIQKLHEQGSSVLLITHYQRLLNYLTPNRVVVMKEGKIVQEGGMELVEELERTGYGQY